MPRILTTLTVILGLAGLGQPALAIGDSVDAKRKINIAGAQRMLSQRIAGKVCLAAQGIEVEKNADLARAAADRFGTALAGLRLGDADLGIAAEGDTSVLIALAGADTLWKDYLSAMEVTLETPATLGQVSEKALPMLLATHKVVVALETMNADTSVDPFLARALNVSGRQRMLTQRALAEACLMSAGYDAPLNAASLKATIALFDDSQVGLIDGNGALGLDPAPTPELKAQLEKVAGLWVPMREILTKAANGTPLSAEELGALSANLDTVLKEANVAVGMYEAL
ncbi:type IV pili methyl-accepting chemotaxis transducer N-terminal domain-containing protein [Psychromarinibacter sp. S121]|uniref:type IV pili methyl-accepting chemotaxis transducer N-terminal domain-containing protein n=1 Tax=Psychromarinibacter sp. S121 TaxID=3415127 RepID=UPI003C7A24F3